MLKMFEQVISLFETLISSSGFWALASAFLGYRYGLKMQIVKIEKEQKLDIVKEKIKVINEYLDIEQNVKNQRLEDFIKNSAIALTKVMMYCSDENQNKINEYISFTNQKLKNLNNIGGSMCMPLHQIDSETECIINKASKIKRVIRQELQEILNMYIKK